MRKILLSVVMITIIITSWAQDPNWQYAAEMSTVRRDHAVVTLADGKLLAVGGFDGTSSISSAEVYDPYYNVWTAASSMNSARSALKAVLLNDGRVLVAGGFNSASGNFNTTEIYDPASDAWTMGPDMSDARSYFSMTKLADGKVMLAGGYNGNGAVGSVDVFDPSDNSITATSDFPVNATSGISARQYHSAELLNDGRVLVACGRSNGWRLQDAIAWDPSTGEWSSLASLTYYRDQTASLVLPDGRVIISGGSNYGTSEYGVTYNEVYDPVANVWSDTIAWFDYDNFQGRYEHEMFNLDGNRVMATGGTSDNDFAANLFLAEAQIYSLSTNSWVDAFMQADNAFPVVRFRSKAAALVDGKKIITTGGMYASTEIYDENPIILSAMESDNIDIVEGNSTEIKFIWNGVLGSPISYNIVLYDSLTGDAKNSMMDVASDDGGLSTYYTMTYGEIYSMLEQEHGTLAAGSSYDITWAVHAEISGYKSISLKPITFSATVFDPQLNIAAPSEDIAMAVEDGNTDELTVSWNFLTLNDETYTYKWEAVLAGGDFSTPFASAFSDNGGADAMITLTGDLLDQMLEEGSIDLLTTTSLEYRVVATLGTSVVISDTLGLELTRGVFYPSTPESGQTIQAKAGETSTVAFTWKGVNTSEAITYEWLLDELSGDFSAPVKTLISNESGTDPSLDITLGDLNDILEEAGIEPAASLDGKWAIRATAGSNSMISSSSSITLTRGIVDAADFDLLTPTDGTSIELTNSTDELINFSWVQLAVAGETVKYRWILEEDGTPMAKLESANGGLNPVLSMSDAVMDEFLGNLGVEPGETLDGKWYVEATFGADDPETIFSNDTFNISFTRNLILAADKAYVGIEVFPNPVSEKLTIKGQGDIAVRVLDASGKVMGSASGSSLLEMNVSTLNKGLYFLEIKEGAKIHTSKLIVE